MEHNTPMMKSEARTTLTRGRRMREPRLVGSRMTVPEARTTLTRRQQKRSTKTHGDSQEMKLFGMNDGRVCLILGDATVRGDISMVLYHARQRLACVIVFYDARHVVHPCKFKYILPWTYDTPRNHRDSDIKFCTPTRCATTLCAFMLPPGSESGGLLKIRRGATLYSDSSPKSSFRSFGSNRTRRSALIHTSIYIEHNTIYNSSTYQNTNIKLSI
ncbi:unnamed protein product [Trichogramma brassicae]|uniref:Uncharacterized protein n=1 Tax=Trichogramma brassicae TaxID=86971 RepID=A0A6H5I4T3_9HYME|nr:unnamed protein product [Trichogramma brassicae]